MCSVVVPTFNRVDILRLALESLLAQDTYVPYEIIVVDNNSSDETGPVVRAFEEKIPGKVRYVFERQQGLSIARNVGVAAAKGEIVVFIDDDAVASSGWLEALATTYRTHPDASCVGGRIVLRFPGPCPSWFDASSELLTAYLGRLDLGEGTFRLGYPFTVWGGNFSVRRDTVLDLGGFDPSLGWRGASQLMSGEETDLRLRIAQAGGAIYYCGQAVVTHLVGLSRMTKQFFRRRAYWEGRTEARLYPSVPSARWNQTMRLGSNLAKDCVRALLYYSVGDRRRAFVPEVTAYVWLGRLREIVVGEKVGRLIETFGHWPFTA